MRNLVSLFLIGLFVWFLFGSAFGVQAAPAPKCLAGSTCLENPLESETTDAPTIIGIVIKAALGVIGAITLLMFVVGASEWLTSAGNPEKVSAGAKTMLWAAIGALLVFASYITVSQLTALITGTTGRGTSQGTNATAPVATDRDDNLPRSSGAGGEIGLGSQCDPTSPSEVCPQGQSCMDYKCTKVLVRNCGSIFNGGKCRQFCQEGETDEGASGVETCSTGEACCSEDSRQTCPNVGSNPCSGKSGGSTCGRSGRCHVFVNSFIDQRINEVVLPSPPIICECR